MPEKGFRDHYAKGGPGGYYREHGDDYANPHEPAVAAAVEHAVRSWAIDFTRVLDLGAGGGEATLALLRLLPEAHVEGLDPYTARLYEQRTGRRCLPASFEQIVQGIHTLADYSCILASCSLHLAEESWLPPLCLALAMSAPHLLVITPLTRPEIKPPWGWLLAEAASCSADGRTVRARWYRRHRP